MLILEKVRYDLDNSGIGWNYSIQQDDNGLYVGFDIDENEDGDTWNEYCEIQNELRELGYELHEVSTEHDYIGGYLKEYVKWAGIIE